MLAFAIYCKYLCLDIQLDELLEYIEAQTICLWNAYVKPAVSFMRESIFWFLQNFRIKIMSYCCFCCLFQK